MGKKRDLSDFERGMVVSARRSGLSIHPFMTTVYPSSDGYFQQDTAPCHKAQIISDGFLEHDNDGLHSHQILIQ